MAGTVEAIHVTPERRGVPEPVGRATVHAGRGIEGDYHCEPHEPGSGDDLTLIAAEAVERLAAEHGIWLGPGESRRNVTTRGVDLNALVGRRFQVGDVEAVGVELCEPCMVLARLTGELGVIRGLAHRGGLRADVVAGGEIAVGDAVVDRGPLGAEC
jgi:MOSC domain-containing protein YiiM